MVILVIFQPINLEVRDDSEHGYVLVQIKERVMYEY